MSENGNQCLIEASRPSSELILNVPIDIDLTWREEFIAQTTDTKTVAGEVKTTALFPLIESEVRHRFSGYQIVSVTTDAVKGVVACTDSLLLRIHCHGEENVIGLIIHLLKNGEEVWRMHMSLSSLEPVDVD